MQQISPQPLLLQASRLQRQQLNQTLTQIKTPQTGSSSRGSSKRGGPEAGAQLVLRRLQVICGNVSHACSYAMLNPETMEYLRLQWILPLKRECEGVQ
jgi:hypothetical protein